MECFKNFKERAFKTDNNDKIITNATNNTTVAYGATVIPYFSEGIYKWVFQIVTSHYAHGCHGIGIDDADMVYYPSHLLYGYRADGYKWSNGDRSGSYCEERYNEGDIIQMILNLQNKTLSFGVNDKQIKEFAKVKPLYKGFRMALVLHREGDCISMLAYSGPKDNELVNADLEAKYIECIKEQQHIRYFKQENVRLNEELVNLKKTNQIEIQSLKRTIIELQKQNKRLMEEQKDLQTENDDMKSQNKSLQTQFLGTSRFNEWNYESIFLWIMSLDNRFGKYESKLLQSLKEQDVNGSNLIEVNELDIMGWSVINFNDKKYLMKKIKALINKVNNEGAEEAQAQRQTALLSH